MSVFNIGSLQDKIFRMFRPSPVEGASVPSVGVVIENNSSLPVPVNIISDSSSDLLNVSGIQSTISVTTTPQIVKVGASNLPNRKIVLLQPNGKVRVGFIGITSLIGTKVLKDQVFGLNVGPLLDFYICLLYTSPSPRD